MASQVDLKEMNASQGDEARMSEGLDFSAADRVDDDRVQPNLVADGEG